MTPRIKILLIVLGVALLGWLWKQRGDDSAPSSATRATGSPELGAGLASGRGRTGERKAGSEGIEDLAGLAELRLADLDATPPSFTSGRNPFAFYVPPPPPPPPPPPGPTAEELEEKAAAAKRFREEQEIQRAQEAAIPKPPPITFAYVGSFGPVNRRIAVLSDGTTTYNAMVGDVIAGKFRLVAIGFESIDIGFVDFPNLPAAQLPVGEEGGT